MTKKANIILLIILLIVLSIIYIGSVIRDNYSFAKDIVLNPCPSIKTLNNDTITVIFIGDSWAAYHSKYDQHLKTCIERRINKPTKIISKGTVGAKTKFIYTNMHDHSLLGAKALIDISPDYAIISAGINDAVAKMGTENYCYHYNLIIKELISADIKPIIIDMPQVDYKAIYQRESLIARIRHHISSWITGAPLWSFDNYRTALQSLIQQDVINKLLIYIPASEWNPEGYNDSRHLYLEDHVHLNEKGYFLLDSCLTSTICQDIMSTHDFQ
jgi:lysophospholipase L1-like esterase